MSARNLKGCLFKWTPHTSRHNQRVFDHGNEWMSLWENPQSVACFGGEHGLMCKSVKTESIRLILYADLEMLNNVESNCTPRND